MPIQNQKMVVLLKNPPCDKHVENKQPFLEKIGGHLIPSFVWPCMILAYNT
jgi:hypothetical protein